MIVDLFLQFRMIIDNKEISTFTCFLQFLTNVDLFFLFRIILNVADFKIFN